MTRNLSIHFYCEHCGRTVSSKDVLCPHCGKLFSAVRCPKCSYTGRSDEFKFGCPVCGFAGKGKNNVMEISVATTNQQRSSGNSRQEIGQKTNHHPPFWVVLAMVLSACTGIAGLYVYLQ